MRDGDNHFWIYVDHLNLPAYGRYRILAGMEGDAQMSCILEGKAVEFQYEGWKNGTPEPLTGEGYLVDFYASADEGIFALIMLTDGTLRAISSCNVTVKERL